MVKRTVLISTLVASMLTVSLNAKGYDNDSRGGYSHSNSRATGSSAYMDTLPSSELTDKQKSDLLYMVEEEKLARDTYLYFNNLWESKIFQNIANSEQKHMDRMKALAEKYSLEIPVTFDTKGEFQNEELQTLYNTLIEKGKNSLVDALEVGVSIEEADIADLEGLIDTDDLPKEFKTSYEKLLKGSYNHLKNFNKQLGR
jgi:hypothetical protein